jgi:hypothetical protein
VLPILVRLSLKFQRDNVVLSTIQPMVESTSISLHSLLDVFGDCEKQFDNELTNNGRKPKNILKDAHKNLRRRFIHELQIDLA